MNITYTELLKDQNWAKIRKDIVKRDLLECQNCKNENIKKSSLKGEIIKIRRVKTMLELLNRSDPRFQKLYEVTFLDELKNEQKTEIKTFFEYEKDELDNFKGTKLYFNKAKNLKFLRTNAEYDFITCIPDPTNRFKWFYANQLHVHHTFYDNYKKPWEYPLKSLITLCWKCHSEVHNN